MTTDDCIKHFGSKAEFARAIGVAVPTVYAYGPHPPALRQLQVEAMTGGLLKAEPGCIPEAPKEVA